MKKITGVTLSTSLAVSLALPTAAGAQSSFSDISEDFWAKDAINQLEEADIITGYDNGEFRPNSDVTRGQAALMLSEALELDTEDVADPGFSDVASDDEKYDAIAAVAAEGIISGYDDEFKPNEPLTRAQMAKVLAEAYDLSGNGESNFTDISEDYWAYDYIDALAANDIATGDEDNAYRPGETTTRAQFATFIDNTMNDDSSEQEESEEPEMDEEIVSLLEDVVTKQQNVETYTVDGTVGINMELPLTDEELSEEEQELLEDSLNMEMDVRGAYQQDPMVTEMIIEQEIPQFDETVDSVSLATDEASYQYITDAALNGYPEEWQDKYIEMNYEDIFGEEAATDLFDMDEQQEIVDEVYDVLLESFGTEYFELQDSHEAIPEDVEYEQVLSFELSQEDLSEVMTIFEEEVLPKLEPILENPEAAPAINAVTSNIQSLDENGETIEDIGSEEDMEELLENLNLDNFEMHQAINADNHIVYDAGDVTVSYSDEQGEMSVGFDYGIASSNFNEDISFEYGLPESDEEIVTYDELMEWQEEQMEEIEEFEEIEE
ncbi:S-layer homology domain-containing protein [Salibacterium salarium]|uniref:S-layer homology domain-containing protein n=1 Tax=Salibacterium salarium TaxID=284579 RepID=A0A3R9P360_9BACI|nr:S-layer homology domain-containing protein [Salibacterium salarium]RSL31835.1 S-layer homology domain-containing protein [Salibacterium salarium]